MLDAWVIEEILRRERERREQREQPQLPMPPPPMPRPKDEPEEERQQDLLILEYFGAQVLVAFVSITISEAVLRPLS